MSVAEKYQLVVGLEVHAQLQTAGKLFCSDAISFGAEANTQVSSVSLAHPGTLPVLNKKAVDLAIRLGLALHCDITRQHFFERKNYFYPDLPKGYQISQHTAPVCTGGFVSINSAQSQKQIQLHHMHLEEDAGKSLHDVYEDYTCIDLNRAGTPLLEIVTEPVIHSSEEAFLFLTELRKLLRWLEVCDGNMEEGSMRCDANISVRLQGSSQLGTRVEVKNLNSIRNVKKAIELEFKRLTKMVENGVEIIQETRSFDADKQITFSLRQKESAQDYRYFPEPDLPPFLISEARIDQIRKTSPKLPDLYKEQFIRQYQLTEYDATQLCSDKDEVRLFESLAVECIHYKAIANWILGPIRQYCNTNQCDVAAFPLPSQTVAVMINCTESGKISFQNATGKWMEYLIKNPQKKPLDTIIELHLDQQSDEDALVQWINAVLKDNPDKVKEYLSGKKGLMGMFAGEVKKRSKGKADMQLVQKLLSEKLKP